MANGPLSPVMLIASDGLIQNPSNALKSNDDWAAEYQSIIQTGPVLDQALALQAANVGNISNLIVTSLTTIGSNTVPALGDAVTANLANVANSINNTATFTQVVESRGDQLLGSGDISIFAQVYSLATVYVRQCNEFINSANNTESISSTFTSMDDLTTGGLSQVNSNIAAFGQDLTAIGTTIDLSRLTLLGHPWLLLRQILVAGGLLPGLYAALTSAGISDQDLRQIQSNQPTVSADLDAKIYRVFQTITGRSLAEICELLDVTLSVNGTGSPARQSGGLATAADLLDPVKLLPNTWPGLLVSLPSGSPGQVSTVNIYDSQAQISPPVEAFYRVDPEFLALSRIIPANLAAANLAWARSLQQVKNVINQTLPNLASAASTVETNGNLPYIESLDSTTGPVPASVKSGVISTLGTGSGPDGLLYLNDLLGTIDGEGWANLMVPITDQFANLTGNQAFTDVTNNYVWMSGVLAGTYGNVSVGPINIPGDPTVYNDAGAAMTALIANTIANIAVFQTAQPAISTQLDQYWANLENRLTFEINNDELAGINLSELTTNRSAVLSLGTNLHAIGSDPDQAEFFSSIANVADPAGQAVLASLREARNRDAMLAKGFGIDTQLSAQ